MLCAEQSSSPVCCSSPSFLDCMWFCHCVTQSSSWCDPRTIFLSSSIINFSSLFRYIMTLMRWNAALICASSTLNTFCIAIERCVVCTALISLVRLQLSHLVIIVFGFLPPCFGRKEASSLFCVFGLDRPFNVERFLRMYQMGSVLYCDAYIALL